tara:strand:+ start:194 stop:427 length:234 start_codon:yes stop_codon:yes gene_type:complete
MSKIFLITNYDKQHALVVGSAPEIRSYKIKNRGDDISIQRLDFHYKYEMIKSFNTVFVLGQHLSDWIAVDLLNEDKE